MEKAAAEAEVDRAHLGQLELGKYEPGAFLLAKLATVYKEPLAEMHAWIDRRALFYFKQEGRGPWRRKHSKNNS